MKRRTLLAAAAGAAVLQHSLKAQASAAAAKLPAPAEGRIPVAFPISDGAVVIDYSGPWEVFQDTQVPSGDKNVPGFDLFTVAKSTDPVTVSGGMKVVPNYSFANAPAPRVIVIPAQSGGDAMLEWIRKASPGTDLTFSVCTGAFLLAKTGLLAGKAATTHHGSYGAFAMQFRDVKLKRGLRFVEAGDKIASAGGLTSGIDLALRVVERYYGRFVAERTAFYMEYQGTGWKDAASNAIYAEKSKSAGPSCAVCGMAVSETAALQSKYKNTVYRFCSDNCKRQFEEAPDEFAG
jgi:transcriptional regulator GlxA family with amidase domain/YHS domain-containing protein